MSEFVVLNKADYMSILPLEVVAFHQSAPGACGYHGVIRLITSDRRLYMIRYLYDDWPFEDIVNLFPGYDQIVAACQTCQPLPVGWLYQNMGLGNALFLRKEIRQNVALHGLYPSEIYRQWDGLVLGALDKIEQGNESLKINIDRVAPDWIESLAEDEIFVFGSNILGFHDGGASERALCRFDAIYGQPEGIQGSSYAIPTDGVMYYDLKSHILRFIEYAREHPDKKFLLTKIGCGTAGYDVTQIAPFFRDAIDLSNVMLPLEFWKLLL